MNKSFVIFRKPGESPKLFVQIDGTPSILQHFDELNGKEGFIMAPFQITDTCPLVLLHPTLQIEGWDGITSYWETEKLENEIQFRPLNQKTPLPEENNKQYTQTFFPFISALQNNEFGKLVLSRSFVKEYKKESILQTFRKACSIYTSAYVYFCFTPVSGAWLGCSPEILLSGEQNQWHTVALAGTKTKNERNLWSEKNSKEQEIVAEYLRAGFRNLNLRWEENKPHTIDAGSISHLQTDFTFEYANTQQLGTLIKYLHPTPAVCGIPKEKACRFILANEHCNRRYYSGFIGNYVPGGQTDLYVNLRCMEIHPAQVTLYAGGGLLASSTVESEWKETEDKLQTMLRILN